MSALNSIKTEHLANLEQDVVRSIQFAEQVNQQTINAVSKSILAINDFDDRREAYLKKHHGLKGYVRKPIEIYIDSYGGTVYQCLGLLSQINASKTPIHTIVTGTAMSCGFMIAIHGHKRFAHELSTLMYHQVSSAAWGKIKDMEENVEQSKNLQRIIERLTLERTKLTKKELDEVYKTKTDRYFTADQCVEYGIVDEIIQ